MPAVAYSAATKTAENVTRGHVASTRVASSTSTRSVKYKYLELTSKYNSTQVPATAEARNWLI